MVLLYIIDNETNYLIIVSVFVGELIEVALFELLVWYITMVIITQV